MTRELIVTADDLGLHRGMNDGALEAHRRGIVTACSLVANGREFDHAVELLRSAPDLEVGIHLTFVEEKPLSPRIAGFPKNWRGFTLRYLVGKVNLDLLAEELRLQVEKVIGTGLRVTHINSHQHLHVLPRILPIVQRLAAEHRIRLIRKPADQGSSSRRMAMGVLRRLARRAGAPYRTIGIADAGHLTSARLITLLDFVQGVTELVAHPGRGDIAAAYDWGYDWEGETAALCDPAVVAAIHRHGIELKKPSQVAG